jgi:beta-glucosidase
MRKQKNSWLLFILAMVFISALIGCDNGSSLKGGDDIKDTVYTVTIASNITNGTVKAGKSATALGTASIEAKQGEYIYVSAEPSSEEYRLKSGTLRYRNTATNSGGSTISTSSKRFTMPAYNVTITAEFEESTSGNGVIPPFDYEAWKVQIEVWRTELEPIVAAMTPAEKYGQMTQGEYDHVTPRINASGAVVTGDDVSRYFLGSTLTGGHSGPRSNGSGSEGSAAEWVQYINLGITESMKTRMKIPVLFGCDNMHGASKVKNATMLPHNVGLGAIAVGDLETGREAGYAAGLLTGQEMRAAGMRWTCGPVLGVPEDIRWGRSYECFAEKVDIVNVMGPAVIRGLFDGGVSPGSKHYGPEGQTINGENGGNANMSIAEYREYVTPYQTAIESGLMCIMASYGSRNGTKIHEDKELLTDLLKDELGFEGMLISDWDSLSGLPGGTYKEKLGRGINAGIDMVMAVASRANWTSTITGLEELVNEGTVSQERIDDAVMRILLFKKAVPEFWKAYEGTDEEICPLLTSGEMRTEENKAIAADLVSKSLVLLKNENNVIQKLKTDYNNILLVGTGANDVGLACGGWTVGWQGAAGATTAGVTLYDALREVPGKTVTYSASGSGQTGDYDVVIAVISETPYAEGTGDRLTSTVTERSQDASVLTNALTYGKPVILITYSGRPLHLGDRFDSPDAIISAWWPGSEAGTGIVDVLFGDRDFVGKTAFTWVRTQGGETIYPYGHGLRKSGN